MRLKEQEDQFKVPEVKDDPAGHKMEIDLGRTNQVGSEVHKAIKVRFGL